jgi:hypothetical protein
VIGAKNEPSASQLPTILVESARSRLARDCASLHDEGRGARSLQVLIRSPVMRETTERCASAVELGVRDCPSERYWKALKANHS